MSKWKIDPFIPFHFTILKEFYKIHASPVTPSLFYLMIKLIYGPFLRKGDGLIQSIFHFPISSHFGAILHHSIHLSVFLSSYMNKKLTHIFGHTFCGCSSPCLLYHLQCQKVCFTLFTPLDHFLLPLSIQFLRQHKEVRRLRRCLRCARLASGLHISSPCYNQWRISFAADTTRINNENEDSDKEHTNTPFHFHKGLQDYSCC